MRSAPVTQPGVRRHADQARSQHPVSCDPKEGLKPLTRNGAAVLLYPVLNDLKAVGDCSEVAVHAPYDLEATVAELAGDGRFATG